MTGLEDRQLYEKILLKLFKRAFGCHQPGSSNLW